MENVRNARKKTARTGKARKKSVPGRKRRERNDHIAAGARPPPRHHSQRVVPFFYSSSFNYVHCSRHGVPSTLPFVPSSQLTT